MIQIDTSAWPGTEESLGYDIHISAWLDRQFSVEKQQLPGLVLENKLQLSVWPMR